MITVRFSSLENGSVATVRTAEFKSTTEATAAVKAYAEAAGFTNVKLIDHEDDGLHVRWTARTPGGRNGRNVAHADLGDYDD